VLHVGYMSDIKSSILSHNTVCCSEMIENSLAELHITIDELEQRMDELDYEGKVFSFYVLIESCVTETFISNKQLHCYQ